MQLDTKESEWVSSMETIISKVTAGMERGAASLAAVIDDVRFGHPAEVPRISDRSLIRYKPIARGCS